MLEERIRKYKIMDIHRQLVRSGNLEVARILLQLLRDSRVHLGLDDDSWDAERICDDLGCYIHYDRFGYSAIVYL